MDLGHRLSFEHKVSCLQIFQEPVISGREGQRYSLVSGTWDSPDQNNRVHFMFLDVVVDEMNLKSQGTSVSFKNDVTGLTWLNRESVAVTEGSSLHLISSSGETKRLKGFDSGLTLLCKANDMIAVCAENGQVHLLDLNTSKLVNSWTVGLPNMPATAIISLDHENILAVGTQLSAIQLIDTRTCSPTNLLNSDEAVKSHVIQGYSRSDQLVILNSPEKYFTPITALDAQRHYLAAGDDGGNGAVWDIRHTSKPAWHGEALVEAPVTAVHLHPQSPSSHVIFGCLNGCLEMYDMLSEKRVWSMSRNLTTTLPISCIDMLGPLLVAGGDSGALLASSLPLEELLDPQ